MAEGDALWAGHMVAESVFMQGYFLRKQLRKQDRRVEEIDAAWQAHYDALVARYNALVDWGNRLAADHDDLRAQARALAAARDAAVARIAELERGMAERANLQEAKLWLANNHIARLSSRVDMLLELHKAG